MTIFVRSVVMIVVLILVAYVGLKYALQQRQIPEVERKSEPVLSVSTFRPVEKEYPPTLFLIGIVEALNNTTLTTPVAADVLKIHVSEGDYFSKGNRLLSLDLRDLKYMLEIQESDLEQIKVQIESIDRDQRFDGERLTEMKRLLELEKNDFQRNQELVSQDVFSISQLESVEKAMLQRQLDVISMENSVLSYDAQRQTQTEALKAAEARLQQAQLLIERAQIKAPFSGRVSFVHVAVGDRLSNGQSLLSIFDPTDLRLRVSVPQRYSDKLKSNQNISAILRKGEQRQTLSFSGIQPQIALGDSSIDSFFVISKGEWVLGEVVDIALNLPVVTAIAVPVNAIYNDKFIYRIGKDSRAESISCQHLGVTQDIETLDVQILLDCDQINPDDAIITNQLPSLSAGLKLTVISQ